MRNFAPDAPFDRAKEELAVKVRKLLAQAEDPAATAEEAQAFTAKAQELMTKYSIDLAMVTDAERIDQVVERSWLVPGPYAAQKVALVNAVARANDCRSVYTPLARGARNISVVGFPSDVEWVATLSGSLQLQMTSALATASRMKPAGVHGRTFAVGFVEGFVGEVANRLQRARRQAIDAAEAEERARRRTAAAAGGAEATQEAATTSVALVLVAKAEQVEEEYRVRYPTARMVTRYTRLQSWSGYAPGREAGSRANLARGSVGGRRSLSA
ncbi:MAG TPA: DUF2786 domain-containing protein [Acidimicrobiales bacterium]|nr:DUF2786 domain-containing protein [Acidimicrobiales bacterium]